MLGFFMMLLYMEKYKRTQFIKISNNNNPSEFILDVTTMRDVRLRMSALKAQHRKYQQTGLFYKEIFRFFLMDWSFCVLERGSHPDYAAVKKRRDCLCKEQGLKYKLI